MLNESKWLDSLQIHSRSTWNHSFFSTRRKNQLAQLNSLSEKVDVPDYIDIDTSSNTDFLFTWIVQHMIHSSITCWHNSLSRYTTPHKYLEIDTHRLLISLTYRFSCVYSSTHNLLSTHIISQWTFQPINYVKKWELPSVSFSFPLYLYIHSWKKQ